MNPGDGNSADEVLKRHVLKMLHRFGGNITLVAQELRWSRPTVYAHLEKWGIKRGEWRDESGDGSGDSNSGPPPKK